MTENHDAEMNVTLVTFEKRDAKVPLPRNSGVNSRTVTSSAAAGKWRPLP